MKFKPSLITTIAIAVLGILTIFIYEWTKGRPMSTEQIANLCNGCACLIGAVWLLHLFYKRKIKA